MYTRPIQIPRGGVMGAYANTKKRYTLDNLIS